jgi:hypothetical protein
LLSIEEERDLSGPVEGNPAVRTRKMATESIVAQISICSALNEQLLCAHHSQRVQRLKPADSSARESLCLLFVQQCAEPLFLLSLLLPEEDGFGIDGMIHFHNHHRWEEDNPRGVLQSTQQQQFSNEVTSDVVSDR